MLGSEIVNTKILVCMVLYITMLLWGCSGGKSIRVSDSMYHENPIKEVALVGEGRVFYPRMFGNDPVIGVAESKIAIESILSQVETILKNKGYDVIFSEPAGIGYYMYNFNENWVYEDYYNSDRKWTVENGQTVYEYPSINKNEALGSVVKKGFEEIELAILNDGFQNVVPLENTEDLAALRQATGADTVCFSRVSGHKYTDTRKTGTAAMAAGALFLGAMTGSAGLAGGGAARADDMIDSQLICISSLTGEVLWSYGGRLLADPVSPDISFTKSLLDPFPDIGTPIKK